AFDRWEAQRVARQAARDKEEAEAVSRIQMERKNRDAQQVLETNQKEEEEDLMTRLGLSSYKKSAVGGDRLPGIQTEDEKEAIMFLEELGVKRDTGKVILSYFPQTYQWEPVTEPRVLHQPLLPWTVGGAVFKSRGPLVLTSPYSHYISFDPVARNQGGLTFHVGEFSELLQIQTKEPPTMTIPLRAITFKVKQGGSELLVLAETPHLRFALYMIPLNLPTVSDLSKITPLHSLDTKQYDIVGDPRNFAFGLSSSGNTYAFLNTRSNTMTVAYRNSDETKWNVTIKKNASTAEVRPWFVFATGSDDILLFWSTGVND